MTEPRYSDKLKYWEFLIASRDELDIEAELLRYLERGENYLKSSADAQRVALRRIDELKVGGGFQQERDRLAAMMEPTPERFEKQPDPELMAAMRNLFDGLRSPDPEQRKRFEAFWAEAGIGAKSLHKVKHTLAVLETAKKPNGRPSVSPPWRNDVAAMDAMRLDIGGGMSIADAARKAQLEEGKTGSENRARRFVELFGQRQALRE